MTDNNESDRAGDFRRAALLTKYRRQDNKTGEVAIAQEANETGRVEELITAVLVLHMTFIPRFRTPDGIQMLGDYFDGIATLEGPGVATEDITRAAQIINHHGKGDRSAIGTVLDAAKADGRLTHTLLAMLDHYEVALPELNSHAGIAFIEANATAMLEAEFNPDDLGGG